MTMTVPQGSNTYVPNHEASGKLVVGFSRNPAKFKVAKYAHITPVTQQVGFYLNIGREVAARVLDNDAKNFDWPDGADRPKGNGGLEGFEFLPFVTQRKAYPFNVGYLASGQATWDVLAAHGAMYAQLAMTIRTQRVMNKAQTAANYDASHTSDVASISGVTGKWDASTTARMDIMKSIHYGCDIIRLDTNGVVTPDMMQLVLSPGCARKMASCQEIADHVKGSPAAKEYITKGLGPNAQYGLPEVYAGVPIVVEDAVKVTSKKGATRAASYITADAKPFLCSVVGGLEGVYGSPNFSTFNLFAKEDMTVEQKDDPDNRRTNGSVVDDIGVVMTAPVTGFLFTLAVN